jgi:osmotically-inducible protein OsmY
MAENVVANARPDVDIAEDIRALILSYPPLVNDRRHIAVNVEQGEVSVAGYVKSPMTRRYLMDIIPTVDGVRAVDSDGLYDDEMVRLEVARIIPSGVQVVVEYGAVVLAGQLPEGTSEEALAQQAANVQGVRKVVTSFKK